MVGSGSRVLLHLARYECGISKTREGSYVPCLPQLKLLITVFMAPKEKPPHELGSVVPARNGWRVRVLGKDGPYRTSKHDAKSDLAFLQAAATREEMLLCLRDLNAAQAHGGSQQPSTTHTQTAPGLCLQAVGSGGSCRGDTDCIAPLAPVPPGLRLCDTDASNSAAAQDLAVARSCSSTEETKDLLRSLRGCQASEMRSVSLGPSGLCLVASGSETSSQQAQAVTSPTAPGLYPQSVESDVCSARDTSNAHPSAPSPSKRLRQKSPAPVVPDLCHTAAGSSHDQATTAAIPAAPGLRLLAAGSDGSQPMNLAQQLTLRGLNIQYPFSQLLLMGAKTVEARTFPLGYFEMFAKHMIIFDFLSNISYLLSLLVKLWCEYVVFLKK